MAHARKGPQPTAPKIKIGKMVSPGAPPKLLDEKLVLKVYRSHGEFLYGTFIDPLTPNAFVRFKNYLSDTVMQLNTAFIVSVLEVKVVKVESDLTQNQYYSEKGNRAVITYALRADAEYELVNDRIEQASLQICTKFLNY